MLETKQNHKRLYTSFKRGYIVPLKGTYYESPRRVAPWATAAEQERDSAKDSRRRKAVQRAAPAATEEEQKLDPAEAID